MIGLVNCRLQVSNYSQLSDYTVRLQFSSLTSAKYLSLYSNYISGNCNCYDYSRFGAWRTACTFGQSRDDQNFLDRWSRLGAFSERAGSSAKAGVWGEISVSFMPGYQVFLVQATNMASLTSLKRCFGDRKEATKSLK